MESTLNLNTLASSLPTAYQNAEKELMSDFKAAALSITTFYRSSRNASKRAYNAGYAAACQDLLTMIQQGVSVGGINTSGSVGTDDAMSIGKVMDWIEARLEAIKSREEEEAEDEEKEKERDRAARSSPPTTATVPTAPKSATIIQPFSEPTAPSSSAPTSPSPPPPSTARSMHPPQTPLKTSKHRARDVSEVTFQGERMPFPPPAAIEPIPLVGSKRRHHMMVMLDPAPSPISSSPASSTMSPPVHSASVSLNTRRRTRSSRSLATLHQHHNVVPPPEAMDVEEEGRDRKRVARR
ncbi:hypothetical protein ONZ45_g1127 [Pleurotus djamor]|nr:hypothetical protein ONZ45_g1127 [Pleurotus djamor]